MKIQLKIFYLIILIAVFSACGSDCAEEQTTCLVQDLGITEENKIPITLNQDYALYSLYPLNWKWKNLSDNLIETVYNFPSEDDLDDSESFHLIFSVQDDCIDLIRDYKKTEYHNVAPDTGIVYTTNIVFEDNELNFSLQEYNANYLVVGQNNTMKFWIEFNEDNHIAE